MWVWNARLQLRALAMGLRSLLLVPPAPAAGDQDGDDASSKEACPRVSGEAAATVERVAADIEAYLSQVKPNQW